MCQLSHTLRFTRTQAHSRADASTLVNKEWYSGRVPIAALYEKSLNVFHGAFHLCEMSNLQSVTPCQQEKASLTSQAVSFNRVLRLKNLATYLGLSESTIYDKLNKKSPRYDPTFPKQIRLSASKRGAVGWLEHELRQWLESRTRA